MWQVFAMSKSLRTEIEDRLGLFVLSSLCVGLLTFLGVKFIFSKDQPKYGLTEREAVEVFHRPVNGIRVVVRFDEKKDCRCKLLLRGSVFTRGKRLADFVLLLYRDADHIDMRWQEKSNLSTFKYELEGGRGHPVILAACKGFLSVVWRAVKSADVALLHSADSPPRHTRS